MALVDSNLLSSLVRDSLMGADGGELFLENTYSEIFMMDNGVITNADYKENSGFGFRSFCGDYSCFVHSSEISEQKLQEAGGLIKSENSKPVNRYLMLEASTKKYYESNNPLESRYSFEDKIGFLRRVHEYTKNKDKRVVQVNVVMASSLQSVDVIDHEGRLMKDDRPLVRLNVSVVMTKDGKRFESGYSGYGGRYGYEKLLASWQEVADDALRQGNVNLESIPAPSGEMQVVLGGGWPGIILHEAIGHGLEGDFNRKKTSVFSNLMGNNIAAPCVTVVDDGTVNNARGSINMDDEGTPSSCTTLIQDGVLVNYMHDRMNANLMGKRSTGNGRRESYSHLPMPRMTNTYMMPGKYTAQEVISSVKRGIYAVSFSGGQVDITSGKFIFSTSEAYMIEDGKITAPIKGATLIGSGEKILKEIDMVADDWSLDTGIGTCSKNGQNLPVGVGQPTIRVNNVTVGGGS